MKKINLSLLLVFCSLCAIGQNRYWNLTTQFDSVGVKRMKISIIPDGTVLDSLLTHTADGRVRKVSRANILNTTDTTAMLNNVVHKALVEIITGQKTFSADPLPNTNATRALGSTTLNWLNTFTNSISSNTSLNLVTTGGNSINLRVGSGANTLTLATTTGNAGLGLTGATAVLHIKAGTATAGTAPLKFNSGVVLTTPEAGAIEWDGARVYATSTTGPTRNTIAYLTDLNTSLQALAIVTSINAKTTGTTALYTVPTGKTAIITSTYIRCTAATAITSGPSVDIGVTAGDIYPNTALTSLNTANKTFGFFSTGISMSATAAQTINLNINTAATGTSQTVEVVMLGILR